MQIRNMNYIDELQAARRIPINRPRECKDWNLEWLRPGTVVVPGPHDSRAKLRRTLITYCSARGWLLYKLRDGEYLVK